MDHERDVQADSVIGHHTPGPWEIVWYPDGHAFIHHEGGAFVANVSGKNHQANAHLIAAAPDLLAALQAIRLLSYTEPRMSWKGWFLKADEIAGAAVAKATMTAQPPAKSENPS